GRAARSPRVQGQPDPLQPDRRAVRGLDARGDRGLPHGAARARPGGDGAPHTGPRHRRRLRTAGGPAGGLDMSRENVEVVRRLYAELAQATRDGELPDLATRPALADLLHPDVEMRGTIGGLSEGAVARGPEGVAKFMADDGQEWDEVVFEPQEFID